MNADTRDISQSVNEEIDVHKNELYHSAMTKKPTADVAGAIAAMQATPARGRGRKSSAYLWLHARHDALAKAFDENPPSWIALAKYLGDNGITNGDGDAPSASSLRSAWLRVVKESSTTRTRTLVMGTAAARRRGAERVPDRTRFLRHRKPRPPRGRAGDTRAQPVR